MALFVPSNTIRGLLVDEDGNPYTAGTPGTWGAFEPSDSARVILVDSDGNPYVAGGGSGDGTVTSVSAGNLSPLFTTNVANPTTTPALTFSLSNAAANTVLGNATGGATGPAYGKVVLAQIANAAASSKLVGSGASGSGASYSEITLGTNLSMSGTTLNASGGTSVVVQSVYSQVATKSTLATTIPADDSIPQSGEGTEVITVSITPTSASNRIRITFEGFFASGNGADYLTVALFQNAATDAISARGDWAANTAILVHTSLDFEHIPATTLAITYRIRAGGNSQTWYNNGIAATRLYGGVAQLTMTATELTP